VSATWCAEAARRLAEQRKGVGAFLVVGFVRIIRGVARWKAWRGWPCEAHRNVVGVLGVQDRVLVRLLLIP
jgi:hypothetical protein